MSRGQIDQFMDVIAGIESGGQRDPVNVQNNRTQAHGLFQIMPNNWSPWAKEAGLSASAPRTAENQHRVARHKMMQYYDQFGSWDAVAVAWFAGPGRARRFTQGDRSVLNLHDGGSQRQGTTVGEYIDKLRTGMGSTPAMRAGTEPTPGVDAMDPEAYDPNAMLGEVFGTLSDRVAGRDPSQRGQYGGRGGLTESISDLGGAGGITARSQQPQQMQGEVPPPLTEEQAQQGSLLDGEFVDENGPREDGPEPSLVAAGIDSTNRALAELSPEQTAELFEAAETASAGEAPPADGSAHQALEIGNQYLGTQYVWGGSTPQQGFDCSGLVQYVFKQMGVDLPRVSADQSRAGQAVGSINEAQPGDLVFWRGSNGRPNHIGIYAGGGKFLESPNSRSVVRYSELSSRAAPDAIRRVA